MFKILIVLLISISCKADILEGNILENSVIRASDINYKFNELKTLIQNNEFLKITEIYSNETDLSLGNEITSTELNNLFNSA